MGNCILCRKETKGNHKWCGSKPCQENKRRHQQDSKAKGQRSYNKAHKVKDGKLNGRFCQYQDQNKDKPCGKALRGWFFFNCPYHSTRVDDYTLRTNVCL